MCSGQTNWDWTWHGPAPSAVVLKVDAHAQWSVPPGAYDDGLGQNDPKQSTYYGPTLFGQQQNGTAYVVKNVGPSGTVHYGITPTASANHSTCSVGVSVTLTPVVLSVDGTSLVAGDLKTLIGRGQTGKIGATGYDLKNHNWTVSGPQLFDHVDWSNGHAYAPFTGAHTDPTVSFYASKDGAETVNCTCDVYLQGTTTKIGSATGVANVEVEHPVYSLSITNQPGTYTGYVEANNDPTQVTEVTSTMSSTGPLALSVVFTYTAVNPEDFDIDAGKVGLCQLVKENSTYTPNGGVSMTEPQLDETYPYHNKYVGVDDFPNTNPTQNKDDDGPSRDLTGKTSFTLNILYITTEMYHPDGGVDVPLHTGNWSWITSGVQNSTTLLWSPPSGGLTTGNGGAEFDLPSATWKLVSHV